MFVSNPVDLETQRRQALARVYALLIRLAEGENSTSDRSEDTLSVDRINPIDQPKENQGKQ